MASKKRVPLIPGAIFDLVYVEWLYSRRTLNWEPVESIDVGTLLHISVGFKIQDESDFVTIGGHMDSDMQQACASMTIPRPAIKRILVLQKAEKINT